MKILFGFGITNRHIAVYHSISGPVFQKSRFENGENTTVSAAICALQSVSVTS